MTTTSKPYRAEGFRLLSGNGLEIGAFHQPAEVPGAAQVEYFDTINERRAGELFPEIAAESLVKVDYIGDLDGNGLEQFPDARFDFVIISHVLEHVANPIRVIREVLRITRKTGRVVIAIPDKRYTFDRGRDLTPFEHLWSDFENDVRASSDEHYLDFLRSAGPHVFEEPAENLPGHVARARQRREHAHVWDSASFRSFLTQSFTRLDIKATCCFESVGDENRFEYFGVWEKR